MKYTVTFEKRMEGTSGSILWMRLLALAVSVGVSALLLWVLGYGEKLGQILQTMFIKPIFTDYGILDTIAKSTPLIIASVGVAVAFKMKLWNIGAEGQIAMGAFAATGMCMLFPNLPAYLLIPLMMAAGMVAGALWGLLAAAPRAFWGVNETIITLMLNYVATLWLQYLITGPWRDPAQKSFPMAAQITKSGWFPRLAGTDIHLGLLVGVVLVVLFAVFISRSKWGYEVRAIGESPKAARYAGMNVTVQMLIVMAVSGAIAGLAGVSELAGVSHRIETGISGGYGFTAVIIAWLARLNPVALVAMSLLMGALLTGGIYLRAMGIPAALSEVIEGIILFFVLGLDFITRYKLVIQRREETKA